MTKWYGRLAGIISYGFGGFVTSVLWNWHLAPLGLPEITQGQALGIMFTYHSFKDFGFSLFDLNEAEPDEGAELLAKAIIAPLLLLIGGWFFKP